MQLAFWAKAAKIYGNTNFQKMSFLISDLFLRRSSILEANFILCSYRFAYCKLFRLSNRFDLFPYLVIYRWIFFGSSSTPLWFTDGGCANIYATLEVALVSSIRIQILPYFSAYFILDRCYRWFRIQCGIKKMLGFCLIL